jgi:hypothetical protein
MTNTSIGGTSLGMPSAGFALVGLPRCGAFPYQLSKENEVTGIISDNYIFLT